MLDKSFGNLRASEVETVQRNCFNSIGENCDELRIQFVAQVRGYDPKSLPFKKPPDFPFENEGFVIVLSL